MEFPLQEDIKMEFEAATVESRIGLSTKYVGLVVLILSLLFSITALLIGRMETSMIHQFDTKIRGLITKMTQDQINELRETQHFKITQLTKLLAASSEQPFANYDYRTMEHCSGLAVKDGDISFVNFRTQDGQSVASAGRSDGHPADQIIHQQILDGDQKLGEVQVDVYKRQLKRKQRC